MTWKTVIGFDNYEVSDLGEVRSKPGWRAFGNQRRWVDSTVLKPRPNGGGYFFVTFWDGEKKINRYIHRLIAEAFLGTTPQGLETNHKDGNKGNNAVLNLEWISSRGNKLHKTRVLKIGVGESHGMAKLTAAKVAEIRVDQRSRSVIAAEYKVTEGHVGRLKRGELWV